MNPRAAAVLAALLLAPAPALAAPPEAPEGRFTINAAGATFPFPLIDLWRVEIAEEHPGLSLNYQSIGSGGGVQQHIARTVNFAASDAPLRPSEAERAPGTLHIPESIGGVVVAYNLPEVPDSGLRLDGEALAGIYLGEITAWDDPRIAEDNPGLELPAEAIFPVRRSDGSGTTFVFTDYLASVSPAFEEAVGKGKSVPWPAGAGAAGNEGVAGTVRSTPYSVGYVELAYAFQTGMSYASVLNGDGTAFVEPTIGSISAASAAAAASLPDPAGDWSGVSLVGAPGEGSYPISSLTYLLVYEDLEGSVRSAEEAAAVVYMVHWMLTEGQEHAPGLLYVPLSEEAVELGKGALSRVAYAGEPVWGGHGPAAPSIPSWVRDLAGYWAAGEISDAEYLAGVQYLVSAGVISVGGA